MNKTEVMYSVYLSNLAVELRIDEGSEVGSARFICSQFNYGNILEFASNLAKYKKLPFKNHVEPGYSD